MKEIQQAYNEAEKFLKRYCKTQEKIYEDVRFILPNATETKIIVTMNARELMYFFKKRTCNIAKWKIRTLAKEMYKLVLPTAPSIFEHAGPECLYRKCYKLERSYRLAEAVRDEFKRIKKM